MSVQDLGASSKNFPLFRWPFYVIRETLCYTKQLNFDLMHASEILRNTEQKDNRLNTTNLRAYDERNC